MKTKDEILSEFTDIEPNLYIRFSHDYDGIEAIDKGCECCSSANPFDEEELSKEIERVVEYKDRLIKLRDDMKGKW